MTVVTSSLHDTKGLKSSKDSKEVLLEISASSHFDYSQQLNEYRKEFKKKWEQVKPSPHIKGMKFEHLPVLGVGQYGTVVGAIFFLKHFFYSRLFQGEDGKVSALKILEKEHIVKNDVIEKTIMEKKLLSSIRFPFLVSLIFSNKDNDYLYIGLPFAAGGDLFSFHRKRTKFSESMTRFYASQILLALEYLHNIKCLYRDLKLENVLIDANGYLKLTDFGLSKLLLNSKTTTTLCGTPEYLSPEMINVKPYSYSVDWWTFGILVFELVAGQTPFSKYSDNLPRMFSKICEGEFEIPNYFSPDLQNLISGLLDVRVGTRLGNLRNGCNDIKNHNFFRTINWRVLLSQNVPAPFRPRLLHPADTIYFEKVPSSKLKRTYNRSGENLYSNFFANF